MNYTGHKLIGETRFDSESRYRIRSRAQRSLNLGSISLLVTANLRIFKSYWAIARIILAKLQSGH